MNCLVKENLLNNALFVFIIVSKVSLPHHQMLSGLVEVHGEVVRESFSEGVIKKWLLDANAGGAFPWADPFQVVTIK